MNVKKILQRRLHIAESLYAVLLHLVSHRLTKKCVECCALSGPWSQGYIVKRMVQNFRIGAKEEDVLEYLEEALELPTATCDCLEQQVKKFARVSHARARECAFCVQDLFADDAFIHTSSSPTRFSKTGSMPCISTRDCLGIKSKQDDQQQKYNSCAADRHLTAQCNAWHILSCRV